MSSITEPDYWITHGYPAFSRYLSSGRDLFVLRRFGEENALVLLHLQNKIRLCVERLRKINIRSDQDPDKFNRRKDRLTLSQKDSTPYEKERDDLIMELQSLLAQYNQHVLSYAQVRALPSATKDHIRNLDTWHRNHQYAIEKSERYDDGFEYDLVSITYQPQIALARLLAKLPFLRWLFRNKPKPGQVWEEEIESWSDKGMKVFSDIVAVLFGLGMLLGPMWWLNYVTDSTAELAIISGFVTLFASVLITVCSGKPVEVLAATAAYSAVLVVFLQNTLSGRA